MNGETITDKPRRNVILLAGHPELTVTWSRYAPGEEGPGLHVHREHTDAFYVLDGGLPADEVALTAAGGGDLPELLVRPGHGVVHVEAAGRRLAVQT